MKYYQISFLKILSVIVIVATFEISSTYAQMTAKNLEIIYNKKAPVELEAKLKQISRQTDSIRLLSQNDTTDLISELFSSIVVNGTKKKSPEYFFLQLKLPRIRIDSVVYKLEYPFVPEMNNSNLFPLISISYFYNNIKAIKSFVGPDPYKTYASVKRYIKSKGFIRKYGFWNAKKKIKEHQNRYRFVGQFLILPGSSKNLDRGLQPYKLSYIDFNKNLTEVEIRFDRFDSGGIYIYKLIDGNWIKTRTILEWIE